MNSVALETPAPHPRRWLGWLALIFIAQLVLIYALSGRTEKTVRQSPTVTPLLLFPERLTETEFAATFLVGDPTLFISPNSHGFSGPAWLNAPPRNYEKASSIKRTEPSFWLALNLQQFGTTVSQFIQTNPAMAKTFTEKTTPNIQLAKVANHALESQPSSQLRLDPELARRELLTPPQLQSWANTELLSNSVVQVSVDAHGSVQSAQLLSRSGFPSADAMALDAARNLQFSPSDKNEVIWGKIIFVWQTIAMIATNSASEVVQPK